MCELRKTGQDFWFRHAAGHMFQHFADCESCATDTGFTEANRRIDTDAIKRCHGVMIAKSCLCRKTESPYCEQSGVAWMEGA